MDAKFFEITPETDIHGVFADKWKREPRLFVTVEHFPLCGVREYGHIVCKRTLNANGGAIIGVYSGNEKYGTSDKRKRTTDWMPVTIRSQSVPMICGVVAQRADVLKAIKSALLGEG